MPRLLGLKRVFDGGNEDLTPNKRTRTQTKCGNCSRYVCGICSIPCAKNASIWNRTIFLSAFMQGSSCGVQLTPLVVGIKLDKNAQFFVEFFCYSIGVCNKHNK